MANRDRKWKSKVRKKRNLEPEIELSINILSQIIAGTISPQKAYELGYITVNNFNSLDKFNKLFPEYPTFCWDYF